MTPRVFISAVSSELRTTRQLVANVLARMGYTPVWEDIFGTDAGDLRSILRAKIDDCDGLIHLVGAGYGTEPPQPDADFGRVSYTQFEFLYAQQKRKKTWVVFTEEGCTRDTQPEQLDFPCDLAHHDPAAFQAERRAWQDAWSQRLKSEGLLYHDATNDTELELKVERLKDEFAELRQAFRSWQRNTSVKLTIVAVALIAIVLGVFWMVLRQSGDDSLRAVTKRDQKVSWDITVAPLFTKKEPKPKQYDTVPAERHVAYEQIEIQGTKAIVCRLPYRDALDREDQVAGADFMAPMVAWNYPNIAIKAVNNLKTSVMITGAIIRVKRVEVDDRPLLVVQDRSYNSLQFHNMGWGKVVDPVVRFSLARTTDPPASGSGFTHVSPPLTSFDRNVAVSIGSYVPNSLMKLSELRATGEIEFGPAEKRSRVSFVTTVLQELSSGRPVLPSFQYAVMLDSQRGADSSPYRIAMSQTIESQGGSDQFLLRIGSDRSARYTISVELQSVDGQSLGIQPLILEVFIPRYETVRLMAPAHVE